MRASRERLLAISASTGFETNTLEKVAQLLNLLNALQGSSYLRGRFALKGGTALNLFLFDLPRLSVDVDLNYIGSPDTETMLSERPQIRRAIEAVLSREDLQIQRVPSEHAGGKWRLRYQSSLGGRENLELDLNFMYRIPLWPIAKMDSRKLGPYQAVKIPVVDIYEIFAGKLAALFSRRASRDLFDVHQLLTRQTWDINMLRLGFVLFGAMNRKDWRSVSLQDIDFDLRELDQTLVPVLSAKTLEGVENTRAWAAEMVEECRDALTILFPFTDAEREFLDRLLDKGEIAAELLASDGETQEKIAQHPLLAWKAHNVREHRSK